MGLLFGNAARYQVGNSTGQLVELDNVSKFPIAVIPNIPWNQVSNKPGVFPTTWGAVSGKPSTFPADPATLPVASTERRGIVELETEAESRLGTGTTRAVTGAGLRVFGDERYASNPSTIIEHRTTSSISNPNSYRELYTRLNNISKLSGMALNSYIKISGLIELEVGSIIFYLIDVISIQKITNGYYIYGLNLRLFSNRVFYDMYRVSALNNHFTLELKNLSERLTWSTAPLQRTNINFWLLI